MKVAPRVLPRKDISRGRFEYDALLASILYYLSTMKDLVELHWWRTKESWCLSVFWIRQSSLATQLPLRGVDRRSKPQATFPSEALALFCFRERLIRRSTGTRWLMPDKRIMIFEFLWQNECSAIVRQYAIATQGIEDIPLTILIITPQMGKTRELCLIENSYRHFVLEGGGLLVEGALRRSSDAQWPRGKWSLKALRCMFFPRANTTSVRIEDMSRMSDSGLAIR